MHFAHIHCFVYPNVSYFFMSCDCMLSLSVHQQLHSEMEAVPRRVPLYMATGFPVLNAHVYTPVLKQMESHIFATLPYVL